MILARNTDTHISGCFVVAALLAVVALFFNSKLLAGESALVFLVNMLFVWFIRDPERVAQGAVDDIVSPADGKVIDIRENTVCIFMNINNVHVNRAPIGGTIVKMEYRKGGFLPAFCKDSMRNEQNIICIESDFGLVKMVQIAGTIIRRIDTYFNVGDHVDKGERIGMIRFGSRVDITPPDGYVLTVKKGDKVKAALSVVARRNEAITQDYHDTYAGEQRE